MVTHKVCKMADAYSYIGLILVVAEAHGGHKTAWWYDYHTRLELARDCAKGLQDTTEYFNRLSIERLRAAKMAAGKAISDAAKLAVKKTGKGAGPQPQQQQAKQGQHQQANAGAKGQHGARPSKNARRDHARAQPYNAFSEANQSGRHQ